MTLSFAPERIEQWPLARLQPYARNAKAHGADQVAKIAASMAEFGWTVPCLVSEDGELIAGHGRVLAATQLGLTEAPVIVLGHPFLLKAVSMADISPHLLLPFILAAQAQKHVTHNEAIRLLDAVVQLSVLDRDLTVPPASPVDGDRYIVASGATGLWVGWDLNVTTWVDGVWMRLVPRPGWLAWIADEATFAAWTGTIWKLVGVPQDVSDAIFSLVSDADPTKRALFSLSGISTATTRTFTLPNTSSELAILAGTQTFTGNKTFSGTLTASAATATIGTSAATSTYGMGTGANTTGVTKTVNLGTGGASGSTTVVNIGSATASAGGTTVVNTPTVTFANAVTGVGMPQANLTAQLLGLGGATADATNRLSLNAPAVLLNNAGTGIEVTVNKAAAANDAAFAFKTGFSARALIGLLGNDDFSFKVSPDGSAFFDAIRIDRTNGRPTLPQGAILGNLSADPAGRADGWIWFNATAQRLRARADGVDFNLGPYTGTGVLAVADNAVEASTVIAAPGVLPTSLISVSPAHSIDADENSPEMLDLVTLWGEAGADQITLNATFSEPTSGAVKINWSAN